MSQKGQNKVGPIPEKLHVVEIDPSGLDSSPKKDYKSCSSGSLSSLETSAVSSSINEVNTISDVDYRPKGLSAFATLLNFLKVSFCT